MSTLSPIGARSLPVSLLAGQQNDGKTAATAASAAARQTGIAASNPVSLSSDALDMQKRVASVGSATVDFAQSLLSGFAQKLFGDAMQGAQISYDSASLEAESSYGLAVQHSSGPNGASDAAAFQLNDSSHFIGKGTITTADGRKFDFEVEVQYDYQLQAGVSQTQGQDALPATQDAAGNGNGSDGTSSGNNSNNSNDLPSVQLPNIDFPGTLADLFKLIGVDLQTALSSTAGSDQSLDGTDHNMLRMLSMRLLSLADHKDDDTYATPAGADKAKSVASAYGVSGVSGASGAAADDAPAQTAATPDAAA